MFSFASEFTEDFKNKQIIELAQAYISKTLELIEPLASSQSELFLKATAVQNEIRELMGKTQSTKQDIQVLLSHIKDINQTMSSCKEMASAALFLFPLFETLTFFLF